MLSGGFLSILTSFCGLLEGSEDLLARQQDSGTPFSCPSSRNSELQTTSGGDAQRGSSEPRARGVARIGLVGIEKGPYHGVENRNPAGPADVRLDWIVMLEIASFLGNACCTSSTRHHVRRSGAMVASGCRPFPCLRPLEAGQSGHPRSHSATAQQRRRSVI